MNAYRQKVRRIGSEVTPLPAPLPQRHQTTLRLVEPLHESPNPSSAPKRVFCFWTEDGFFVREDGKLRKVDLTGGAASAPTEAAPRKEAIVPVIGADTAPCNAPEHPASGKSGYVVEPSDLLPVGQRAYGKLYLFEDKIYAVSPTSCRLVHIIRPEAPPVNLGPVSLSAPRPESAFPRTPQSFFLGFTDSGMSYLEGGRIRHRTLPDGRWMGVKEPAPVQQSAAPSLKPRPAPPATQEKSLFGSMGGTPVYMVGAKE